MTIKTLRKLYWLFLVLISGILLATPFFIQSGFSFLREEIIEASIILATFLVAYFTERLYRREIQRQTEIMNDVIIHTARINRHMSTLEIVLKLLHSSEQTPPTQLLKKLAQELLNSIDGGWVLIRIIATPSGRSVAEALGVRKGKDAAQPIVSNKELVAQTQLAGMYYTQSVNASVSFKVFCIAPAPSISPSQKQVFQITADLLCDLIVRDNLYESGATQIHG